MINEKNKSHFPQFDLSPYAFVRSQLKKLTRANDVARWVGVRLAYMKGKDREFKYCVTHLNKLHYRGYTYI